MSERLKMVLRSPAPRTTGGVPDFLPEDVRTKISADEASDGENAVKNFFKRWPRFYDRLALIVSPILFTGLTGNGFAKRFPADRLLLDVGSGHTRLHPNAVNVDVFPFRNVDVLAPAEELPFVDGVFDAVVCDQVLEHVADPERVVRELVRVVKTDGDIYIGVPFIYPYHPSPRDYVRWTIDGVERHLPDCEIVERGVAMGPTSGLLVVLADWLALVFSFGIQPLRKIFRYVFMLALFPFKYLDLIFARYPGADVVAASVYVVARKR